MKNLQLISNTNNYNYEYLAYKKHDDFKSFQWDFIIYAAFRIEMIHEFFQMLMQRQSTICIESKYFSFCKKIIERLVTNVLQILND